MINFLNITEEELAEIVAVQCLNAQFSPDDPRVTDVINWINDTITNTVILSMVIEGKIGVSDVDSDGGIVFSQNEDSEETQEMKDSIIWNEISEIIKNKDQNNAS